MIIFKKIGEYCRTYIVGSTVEQLGMTVSAVALAILVLAIL